MIKKYVGRWENGEVVPFKVTVTHLYCFEVDVEGDKIVGNQFLYSDGYRNKETGWKHQNIQGNLNPSNNNWGYLSDSDVEKYFGQHIQKESVLKFYGRFYTSQEKSVDHFGPRGDAYLCVVEGDNYGIYNLKDSHVEKVTVPYTIKLHKQFIAEVAWKELSPAQLKDLFEEYNRPIPTTLFKKDLTVQAKPAVVESTKQEPTPQIMSSASAKIIPFPAPVAAPVKVISASPKFVLGAGKLYVNVHTKQVERVIDVQGNLVWTSRHKQEAKAYGRTNFRKATDAEVKNYLDEATNAKV